MNEIQTRIKPHPAGLKHWLQIHTNWDIRNHEALKIILETIPGIEHIETVGSRYEFSVQLAELFDKHEVTNLIIQKVSEYFNQEPQKK